MNAVLRRLVGRRVSLVGFVLVLFALLCSHATACPTQGGPFAFVGSSSADCYSIGQSSHNPARPLAEDSVFSSRFSEEARNGAGSGADFSKVHTYFVAASKGGPAVWVHNACGLGELSASRMTPTGGGLTAGERAFVQDVTQNRSWMQIFRSESGQGLGDFVVAHTGLDALGKPALAIEFKEVAGATGFSISQNAGGQVFASEVTGLAGREGITAARGLEITVSPGMRGVDIGELVQALKTQLRDVARVRRP